MSEIITTEALVDLRSYPRNDSKKVKSKSKENKPVEKKAARGFQRKPYASPAKYDKTKNNGKVTGGPSNTKMMGVLFMMDYIEPEIVQSVRSWLR